jgi:hypothetical protein
MTGTRWRYPDVGLEPQHIACAREFVDALPYRDRILAALVSGSRAAGLAHGRSDLDVFVVVADEDRGRFSTLPKRHQDISVDSHALTVAEVQRHATVLGAREAAPVLDRRLYALADYPGWTVQVRLAIGQVVLATTPSVHTLLASVDRNAVRRSLMVHGALCLATFAEDVKGAVECGDLATAFAAAEEAVRCGVDISLAALDDVYIGRKYLPRRMARHPSLAGLLERDDLFGQPPARCADDGIHRIIRQRLLLAGHLAGQSLTGGWQRPVQTVTPFAPGEAGPIRDPYLTPVRWPAGLGLMTGVDIVRAVSEEEATLWTLLDGRPLGAVKTEFARLTGRAAADIDGVVCRTVQDWRGAGILLDPR